MITAADVWELVKFVGFGTPFALYFYYLKFGFRVSASYSWMMGRFVAEGIGSVTLINMKDRPVPIFGIFAVSDGLFFSLRKFDPPLILKGMEAVTADAEQVSERRLGYERFDWEFLKGKNADIDIYLATSFKIVKCRRQSAPTDIGFALKRKLRPVTSHTKRFNGLIYNDRALYAVTYAGKKKSATALIDGSGFVSWGVTPNMLQISDLASVETVRDAIVHSGLPAYIGSFVVDDLRERSAGRRRAAQYQLPPV